VAAEVQAPLIRRAMGQRESRSARPRSANLHRLVADRRSDAEGVAEVAKGAPLTITHPKDMHDPDDIEVDIRRDYPPP
jgi:hypothetical protein